MFSGIGFLSALRVPNVAVLGGIRILLYDTFTDIDNTLITSHTPDINLSGNPYVETQQIGPGSRTSNLILSNRAATLPADAGINALYASCINTLVSDVRASASVFRPVAAGNGNGLVIRRSGTVLWRTDFSNTIFRIVEMSGATNTVRASTAITPVLGNDFSLTFTGNGTAITSTLVGPGVSLTTLNYTSSLNQTATEHGFTLQTATINPSIDELEVRTV